MRDAIIDMMLGTGTEDARTKIDEHLSRCKKCRRYADELKAQDKLLGGMSANLDSSLERQQNEVIEALDSLDESSQRNLVSLGAKIADSRICKFSAAAAILGFIAAELLIASLWLKEIQECISLCC